ncbi:uncharacterized protein LOC121645616 isoform X2 [Melanotaenia boesemani]|uniref:uncharacterized protein LOC121645616 isoform X2 n=1 Tax=Melanotaenia boesemani TaxID=1250792 RepID=UPI001C049CE3|nr:uncharacterized protein LOC121645616 isoform X2 [Melanotaenia boesemani]
MKTLVVIVLLLHVSQHALAGVVEVNKGAEFVLLPCEYDDIPPEDNPRVMWTRSDLSPRFVHQRGEKDHQEEVKVTEGAESVNLPCVTTPELPKDVAVEWTRSDPDFKMVHVHPNTSRWSMKQDNPYCGRTKMKDDFLRSGDLSLTLKYPTVRDEGSYICTTYRDKDILRQKVVLTHITGGFPSSATAVLVLLALVLIVSAGVLYHFRFYFMSVYQVEVESGVESVLLPCRTTVHLPGDAKVEWRNNLNTVHVYQNGSDQPEEQDQFYRTRTEMERNPLQSRNLSLTLKHPTDRDSTTYTCSVYSREGNILMKKQVLLTVRVLQVEVESGVESVLLPCRTTVHLHGDVKVEWRDNLNDTVHVYQNDSDQSKEQDQDYRTRTEMKRNPLQSGDLSLTLKHPTDEDSRTFTCSVYSREGNVLMNKQVHLTVKVYQVEVESGVESVLLPCRTTILLPGDAKVEWRDIYYRMVHVYQNGSDQPEEQNQNYKTRTEMKRNPLQSGDLSLTLKHPTDEDSRVFTCSVYSREGNILMKKQVHLTVRVYQKEVESGVESVLLPCRTTILLPGDAKVEWRDSYRAVHTYQKSSDQSEEQDQNYKTRTEMERNPLQSGDLSLTLKHPTDEDSRMLTCSVYSREGNVLMKKQVHLTVRVCQVEVEEGAEFVLLPFRTTPDLPEEAGVVWWRDEPKPVMKVHVYKDGSDQPGNQNKFYRTRTKMNQDPLKTGDFSLTLEHPKPGDSGRYRCVVWKEEKFRRGKSVQLKVKGRVQLQHQTEDTRNRSSSDDPTPLMAQPV